jgi:hypothetical protein
MYPSLCIRTAVRTCPYQIPESGGPKLSANYIHTVHIPTAQGRNCPSTSMIGFRLLGFQRVNYSCRYFAAESAYSIVLSFDANNLSTKRLEACLLSFASVISMGNTF